MHTARPETAPEATLPYSVWRRVSSSPGLADTCQVSPWGGNAENAWQLYKMPIKASFAESWYRACANDLFCGDGDFFDCAGDCALIAND